MTIHPSTRLLKLWYGVAVLVAIGVAVAKLPVWYYIVPGLMLLATGVAHVGRMLVVLKIDGHVLRYQSGLFIRSTRNMDARKVQDVKVDQGLLQRMLGIGNLSIETAGESSRLVIMNIDKAHEVADYILNIDRAQAAGEGSR